MYEPDVMFTPPPGAPAEQSRRIAFQAHHPEWHFYRADMQWGAARAVTLPDGSTRREAVSGETLGDVVDRAEEAC